MNTPEDGLIGWWPWALAAGGVLGFAGGLLHPDMDPTLSGPPVLAAWVGDPLWIPSHGLILASAVLLLPGLLGLARSRVPLSRTARRASWVAVAASILLILESVPHLAAAFDEAAVLAGQPTPFQSGHLIGAAVVYPLFGLSVAALALLSGRSLVHPIIGVLGAIGAVAWGIAPLAVGPWASTPSGCSSQAGCCGRHGSWWLECVPWRFAGPTCSVRQPRHPAPDVEPRSAARGCTGA